MLSECCQDRDLQLFDKQPKGIWVLHIALGFATMYVHTCVQAYGCLKESGRRTRWHGINFIGLHQTETQHEAASLHDNI